MGVCVFVLSLSSAAYGGGLTLNELFSNGAVLQRDVPIRVRGRGIEGQTVTVDLAKIHGETVVKDGVWEVKLPPQPPGGPFEMAVKSGSESRQVKDVYLGDVWLAAGQSNMQMTFEAAPELLARAEEFLNPMVRTINVRLASANLPQDKGISANGWKTQTAGGLKWISLIGYIFGSEYQKKTGVPVGIIISNQGSTFIENWMPHEALMKITDKVQPPAGELAVVEGPEIGQWFKTNKPCPPAGLYNGMIAPLVNFPIKGVLWYQGENNSGYPMQYAELLGGLVAGWREEWGNEKMLFLVAQLSSSDRTGGTTDNLAWLREQQQRAVEQTPDTGLVMTYDLGEFKDVHARAKDKVARRFLETCLALERGGSKQLGPRLEKSVIEGGRVKLDFDTGGHALVASEVVMNKVAGMAPGTDPEAFKAPAGILKGFQICGADRKFVEAQATIDGHSVIVESPAVPSPVAVRYAWENFTLGNLFDDQHYPAAPFRTDAFPPPESLAGPSSLLRK